MQCRMSRCQQADKALQTAYDMVAIEDYGKGFAHFLLALTLKPALKQTDTVEDTFVDCLKSWTTELVFLRRNQNAVWCYEQACDIWPESGSTLHATGQFFFQSGHQREAVSFFHKAVKVKPHPDWLWDLQNASSSLVERWHFRMLNDRKRNQGYYHALQRAVSKGHQKILDIGSGTGLLSMLVIKAGASKVTACEMDRTMCDLSQNIVAQNKMADSIHINNVKSIDMDLGSSKERYSLVVTEIADAGLLGEGIIPTLQHAWSHLLQESNSRGNSKDLPTSQIIPAGASVFIQLIESDYIRKQHRMIDANSRSRLRGVHVASKSVLMLPDPPVSISDTDSEPYSSENLSHLPGGWKALTSPHLVYKFDFCKSEILDEVLGADRILSVPIICSGRADAIISWFDLHLDEEASLSSSPTSGSCWEQAVYPIYTEELQGNHGNVVEVTQEHIVDILCRCHPTWMSFRIKDLRASEQGYSESHNKPTTRHKHSKSEINESYSGRERCLKISSKLLTVLNDEKYLHHLRESLRLLCVESKRDNLSVNIPKSKWKVTVLDYSGVGLTFFALKSMNILRNQLVAIISHSDGENVVDEIFKSKEEDLEHFRRLKLESMENSSLDDVIILVTDLVETAGILKENALEDIYFYGMQNGLRGIRTIPEVLRIHAVCVESEELMRNTKLIGSDMTLGLNLELINEFKTYTQLDVFLPTLPHKKLTDRFPAFSIDINTLTKCENPIEVFIQNNDVMLEATDSGKITAVVYWFEMISSGCSLSTLDEDTHWMQAAFVIEEVVFVQPGDKLQLTSHFKNNSLSFTVNKRTSCQKI